MEDQKPEVPAPTAEQPTQLLRWPPHGLESLHGRLFPAVTVLGIADIILVVPILSALVAGEALWGLSDPSDALYSLIVIGVGMFLALLGFDRVYHILSAARRGASLGHSFRTSMLVAGDSSRDGGFLLQGARIYRQATPEQRQWILRSRLYQAGCYLFATLWPPLFLAFGVVIASRGLLSRASMIVLAAAIPLVVLTLGVGLTVAEMAMVRRIDRRTRDRAWATAEDRVRVDGWYAELQHFAAQATGRAGEDLGPRLRVAYGALMLIGLLAVIPLGAVGLAGAIGPTIASIAVPQYTEAETRLARAGIMRRYRLDSDQSISAEAGGEALQSLLWMGSPAVDGVVPPVRTYQDQWFPLADPANPDRITPGEVNDLFARARSLTPSERTDLEAISAHPAQAEWSITGRAASADIVGTRYTLPFSEEIRSQPFSLPIGRYAWLRDGARARVAAAVLQLSRGQAGRAETSVREVISTGLLLMDESPFLIDNLIGASMVSAAGEGLTQLYRATGRDDEAETIEWFMNGAADIAQGRSYGTLDIENALESIMADVENENTPRGLRWDSYIVVNSLAPCMNVGRIVFGSGGALEHWRESARNLLVTHPSEDQLYDLYRNGFFGTRQEDDPRPRGLALRLFGAVFGSDAGVNECVRAVSSL